MPTSYRENILPILLEIDRLRPTSVMDIGFGRGKYGFLVKEYYSNFVKKIGGVEGFEPYVTDLQKNIFDEIIIGDIRKIDVPKYDLYLLIDILEHMTKEDAHAVIQKLINKGSKVLISIPRHTAPQGAEYGNELEIHISQWEENDFSKYRHHRVENGISFIYTLFIE